jgi:hypothetical protein
MVHAEFEQKLQRIIRNFAQRITLSRMNEFDAVWDVAIGVCDRYELAQCRLPKRPRALMRECSSPSDSETIISVEKPSAADAPAQIPLPVGGCPDFP